MCIRDSYRRGWFILDFTELYAQKKMTAAQAAALVKSGDWVDYGWAVNLSLIHI